MSFAQVATPRGGARPALPRPVRPQPSSRVRAAPPEKASGKIEPPSFAQVPGLREFAAALQTRRRHIPSQTYADPLMRLFDEFDTDHDGRLTAAEVAAALKSRQVDLSEDLAQLYIDAMDGEHHHNCASRQGFPALVFHMAASYSEPYAQQLAVPI
eukprot:evm.model.scf_38EXC.9 EVM.evm.TU.scf_38EXC.9   scf_38EXC:120853-123817(-)